MVYSHSGDDGDVIYSLASLRQIGGVDLRLTPSTCIVRSGYEPSKTEILARLIRLQPYIRACSCATRKEQHGGGWINCDGFRGRYVGATILDWQSDCLGLGCITHKLWITVPDRKQIAEVLIHRSPRYHNDNFPWWDIPAGFNGRVVMVGSVEEHAHFCASYGNVPYHPTKDFLELAQVIAGCSMFIGNQSAPMAVALGLGVKVVQEVCTYTANCCLRDRPDNQYVRHWHEGIRWDV